MVGRRDVVCQNCGQTKNQAKSTRGKYCSAKCQQDYELKQRAEKWLDGKLSCTNRSLRRIIELIRGYCCEVCGISNWNDKPIVLEVEHKNGDSSNNNPENVCLICPNCHSQTSTYKGANKGNGRHARRVRYAEGKSY